jgi:hypothetical protein
VFVFPAVPRESLEGPGTEFTPSYADVLGQRSSVSDEWQGKSESEMRYCPGLYMQYGPNSPTPTP